MTVWICSNKKEKWLCWHLDFFIEKYVIFFIHPWLLALLYRSFHVCSFHDCSFSCLSVFICSFSCLFIFIIVYFHFHVCSFSCLSLFNVCSFSCVCSFLCLFIFMFVHFHTFVHFMFVHFMLIHFHVCSFYLFMFFLPLNELSRGGNKCLIKNHSLFIPCLFLYLLGRHYIK